MDFLDDMVMRRRRRIAVEYGGITAADRERLVSGARPARPFETALRDRPDTAVIAEVKKASPSAGPIAPDCDAAAQARRYAAGGAAAVSVLVEPESFGGSFEDLAAVCGAVDVPVLCKDFVVDPIQLFVARGHGADAVLLMTSVLGRDVSEYLDLASALGLEALVEVHDAAELETAREAGATLVGVNSRNLRTLRVDSAGAMPLVREAADLGLTVVAESGMRARYDVAAAAAAGADAVLVGEALMRSPYPEDVLGELVGVRKEKGNG